MSADHTRALSEQFDHMNLRRAASTRSKKSMKSVNSSMSGPGLAEMVLRAAALHDDILHAKDVVARPIPTTRSDPASVSSSRTQDGFGLPTSFLASLKDTVGLSHKDTAKTRYSEKAMKTLEAKLRAIAKGEDSRYKDDYFRRTVAIFWGNWQDPTWLKTMKDSRKVEEMILHFVTCSVKTLKKSIDNPDDYRRIRDEQTYWFMLVFREAVVAATPSATELISKLDGYVRNMKAEYEKDKATAAASPKMERNNTELYQQGGSMVKIATRLFGTRSDHAAVLASSRARDALAEITNDLDMLHSGYSNTCSRQDFRDEDSWQAWLQDEIATLSARKEEYTTLVAKFNERNNGRMTDGGSSSIGRFVSGNMRDHYIQLVGLCMDADLDALANMSDNEMVSLSILSSDHMALLEVCADLWRIPHTTVLVVTTAILVKLYLASEIPLECVLEALGNINRYIQEVDRSRWRRSDLSDLAEITSQLALSIPPEVKTQLEQYYQADPNELCNLCALLLHLDRISDVDHPGIDAALERVHDSVPDLTQAANRAAVKAYREFAQPDNIDALVHILQSKAQWLEKHCKKLQKQYPEPVLPGLDLTSVAAEIQIPLFLSELRHLGRVRLRTATSPTDPEYAAAEDIFALYRQSHRMQAMYDAFVDEPQNLPAINPLFEPFVFEWFRHMHTEVAKWVQSAIELDNFTVSGDALTSSSVVDIFASLHQFLRVINELGWTDELRKADFMAEAAVLIGSVVRRYADTLFNIFANEIAQAEQSSKPAIEDSTGWLSVASSKLGRAEKASVTPFNFRPETCIKLNDIAAATVELDRLYFQMDVDKWANGNSALSEGQAVKTKKSLYTIKVARADLGDRFYDEQASLRARVELSDESGRQIALTRTVPTDTAFPRWEESFDHVTDRKTWLMASVQNETPEGLQHIGRAFFKLDEAIFPELSTRDLWLPLDQQGRILVRISREEEKSDPQYFFGKAFWSLRRIETEMVRVCVDKMLPFLRDCISRKTLKKLLRRSQAPSLSTNEALGKLQGLYRSAVSQSESLIPAVKEKSRNSACQALSDVDIESAIGPLLDYFDANLHVLSASLTSANLRSVLSGLWREILVAVEDVIVPPLSDRPSNMRSLTDGELDIVLKWLKFLRDYFHAGGDESGLPLEELSTQAYQDILRIRIFYDWSTDDLMEECVKDFQKTFKAAGGIGGMKARGKTMKSQRNLGTIKRAREERKRMKSIAGGGNGEIILRILRLRPGTHGFLKDQMRALYHAE